MIGCCASFNKQVQLKGAGFSFLESKFADLENNTFNILPLYAINNLIPRSMHFFGQNNTYSEIKNLTKKIFQQSLDKKVSLLTLGSGKSRISSDLKHDSMIWFDYLRFINKLCEETGIIVGIEPLSKEETNFINTIDEAIYFLECEAFSHIGVTADIYHFTKEHDSLESIKKHMNKIVHVHISDKNRDFPTHIDSDLELFLKTLQNNGYHGSISIEIDWKKELNINSNIVKELQKIGF